MQRSIQLTKNNDDCQHALEQTLKQIEIDEEEAQEKLQNIEK